MGLIDEMKYTKILYLADVLEDIQEEMRKDWRMRDYAKSINDIVKDLRLTIAENVPDNPMEIKKVEIRRLFHSQRMDFVPLDERPFYEKAARRGVEDGLLHFIKKNKLIRVRKFMDDDNIPMFTASLIVGIENDADIPREEPLPTFVDNLAKRLEEDKE